MILCIGTTPAVQRVMIFNRFKTNAVNRAVRTLDGTGGKGQNVAKVLTQLGEPALLLGFAGGPRGAWMQEQLRAGGVPFEYVEVPGETRLCTTIIDQEKGQITELVEESASVPNESYERLFAAFERHLLKARAVVISGTLTPGAPVDFYARCVGKAREAGRLCVLDVQGSPLECALEQRPDVVKPNRFELGKTVGRELASEKDVWEAMGELNRKGAGAVVITDGSAKVMASREGSRWKIIPPMIKAANPIGSGDAFTAAMALELARGKDLGTACRAGAACGAANALTWMAGMVDGAEYERLLPEVKLEVVA